MMVYALMIIFFHLHYGVRHIGMLQFLANLNELAYAMICWISTCVKPGKDMLKFLSCQIVSTEVVFPRLRRQVFLLE
uniref:Putative ovule protein n=1 Tax=Solanum chacoense TaxID=4108 RepID=A0A0V0HV15_SOLCH